ncbi:MAG: SDR family NAD(P)-dependent oxidoreductase [Myxococcota bacterium]
MKVLLTGASRGIGAAIARDFGAKKAHVVLVARDAAALERVAGEVRAAGGEATVVVADVTRAEDRDRLLAAAGEVDVLINNAGLEIAVALADQTAEDVERQLALDLHAPIELTRRVLPGMIARGRGAVVMVSSMSGKSPTPYNSVYAAAKHGLAGLVSSVRIELAGTGVNIGTVCPSFVADAGMWSDTGVKAPALMREVPLARVVEGVHAVVAGAGEVLVTPGPVRPLLALAVLFPGLHAPVLRWMGVMDALKERARVIAARRAS